CGGREPASRVREDRRGLVAAETRHDEREQIEIERVPVVVRRSFGVEPIGFDLAIDFVDQRLTADRRPSLALVEEWQCQAAYVQRQRFATQGGVGAEVARAVVFDLRKLTIEGEQQIDEPGLAIV